MAAPPSTAILIVNGFDRRSRWGPHDPADALRFPWISLCLRQIEKHTDAGDYRVLVYDQSQAAGARRDPARARRRGVHRSGRSPYALTPERSTSSWTAPRGRSSSSPWTRTPFRFPTAGSISSPASLRDGAALAGIYRDEMAPQIRPFIHVAGLCIRRDTLLGLDVSFHREPGQDTGQNITDALAGMGRELNRLPRSNRRNFHFLIGGLYGDLLYHHGAGSRHAKFWTSDGRRGRRTRSGRAARRGLRGHRPPAWRSCGARRTNDLGLPRGAGLRASRSGSSARPARRRSCARRARRCARGPRR